MNIGSCPKCGSDNLKTRPNVKNSAHTDVYCGDCGRWIKFASKEDLRILTCDTHTAASKLSVSQTLEEQGYTDITDSIHAYSAIGSYMLRVRKAYLHINTHAVILISPDGDVMKYAGTYEYAQGSGMPLTRAEVLACAQIVK